MAYAGRISTLILSVFFSIYTLNGCSLAGELKYASIDSVASESIKIYNNNKVFFVSPTGNDNASGISSASPFAHIQKALNMARPGDTIVLLPGKYYENIHSVRSGSKTNPITIIATAGAIIYGKKSSGGKIIKINHSYIHLINLDINGNYIPGCTALKCYHDKLIYIRGLNKKLVGGIVIYGCTLKNSWGECLRVKYSKNCKIGFNKISHCGIRDFVYKRGKQNGEGIYIGTAPEQTHGKIDKTHNIFIYNNSIATYGAECVDVKEYSSNIFIYNNLCTKEKASHVGGISVRSNKNTIEGNIVFGNLGAGIRLGGDTKKDGLYNTVIGNYLDNNKMAGLKIMVFPQEKICSNTTNHERPYYPNKQSLKKAYKPCDK